MKKITLQRDELDVDKFHIRNDKWHIATIHGDMIEELFGGGVASEVFEDCQRPPAERQFNIGLCAGVLGDDKE